MSRHGPRNLAVAFAFVLLCLFGASIWIEMSDAGRRELRAGRATPQPAQQVEAAPEAEETEFIAALRAGGLKGAFEGDGVRRLGVRLQNSAPQPVRTAIHAGTIFTTPDSVVQMVTTRTVPVELDAGESRAITIPSSALRLSNAPGAYALLPSETRLPVLERLWPALDKYSDASPETIQTAVLLLVEDPPLAHLARFKLSPSERLDPAPPKTFKVDTQDLMVALIVVTDVVPEKALTLFDSAQLRLESLIDPRSHDAALMFYNIDSDREWDFWKTELLHGDPATRHYALYGIARYFPETAFDMLPRWIMEPQAPLLFRQHAAYALAEIPREEVVRTLVQLESRLGAEPKLRTVVGRAADLARQRMARL